MSIDTPQPPVTDLRFWGWSRRTATTILSHVPKRGIMSAMGLWENHRLHHLASTMPRTRALVPGVAEDSAFRACSRR